MFERLELPITFRQQFFAAGSGAALDIAIVHHEPKIGAVEVMNQMDKTVGGVFLAVGHVSDQGKVEPGHFRARRSLRADCGVVKQNHEQRSAETRRARSQFLPIQSHVMDADSGESP
jgi:hypothetical protein